MTSVVSSYLGLDNSPLSLGSGFKTSEDKEIGGTWQTTMDVAGFVPELNPRDHCGSFRQLTGPNIDLNIL